MAYESAGSLSAQHSSLRERRSESSAAVLSTVLALALSTQTQILLQEERPKFALILELRSVGFSKPASFFSVLIERKTGADSVHFIVFLCLDMRAHTTHMHMELIRWECLGQQ